MTPDIRRKLYWDGLAVPPEKFPRIDEYVAYMKSRPVYTGHVIAHGDGVARTWDEAKDFEVLSYRMEDALAAPGFFEFAVKYTPLIAELFGEQPLMYSFNAFWTRPGLSEPNVHIQQWHRDRDDRKFVALFMYGTDIETLEDGPHHYECASHRQPDVGNVRGANYVKAIYGTAGTCFLEFPFGVHLGVKPQRGERLLAWARWGVSDPPRSYTWDKLAPVPASRIPLSSDFAATDDLRRATRLIVDWGK